MTNKMQLFGLLIYTQSDLHVSGDVFAYHQGLNSHLVHDTGRQQHRWTISEVVNSQVLLMMGKNIARNM